ncbi:MAG TPA: DUF998 domain-containing protein [Chryseosolibacter sp.]|nr:DUF998 domain-containing protein [Chryseosolibacter sp.]
MTTPISFPAARLAFWTAAMFLIILVSLHFIKPGIDPSWNFISEYQVGAFGWLMSVAFFMLAMSCVFLVVALWKYLRSVVGMIGMLMLLLTAGGMLTAAFNPADPINTRPELVTPEGELHQLGAMLDQVPFAAILLTIVLIRKYAYWKSHRKTLIGATFLVCAGLIVFIASMTIYMPADGVFGPHTPFGWPNRLMISVQAVWLMVMARIAIRDNAIKEENAVSAL